MRMARTVLFTRCPQFIFYSSRAVLQCASWWCCQLQPSCHLKLDCTILNYVGCGFVLCLLSWNCMTKTLWPSLPTVVIYGGSQGPQASFPHLLQQILYLVASEPFGTETLILSFSSPQLMSFPPSCLMLVPQNKNKIILIFIDAACTTLKLDDQPIVPTSALCSPGMSQNSKATKTLLSNLLFGFPKRKLSCFFFRPSACWPCTLLWRFCTEIICFHYGSSRVLPALTGHLPYWCRMYLVLKDH